MNVRNHRLGIFDGHAGIRDGHVGICDSHACIDRQLGLKEAGKLVNAKRDELNAR